MKLSVVSSCLRVALFLSIATPSLFLAEALADPPVARQFIELNNPVGSAVEQKLPASFVSSWPTWVLDTNGNLSKIPDGEGFVPPASIDEVWQPVDLKRPDARLAIGLHVRQGMIRHVMPAVDLSLDGKHRNRGMCSVPRAHSWIDFTNSLDEWQNYEIVLEEKQKDKDEWKELHSSPGTKIMKGIERAYVCLAESAPDELAEGSHVVNVLLESEVFAECPRVGSEMRVTMDDDDYLGDAPPPGALQVTISAAAAGSDSEYLPDVYQPLYSDESLRNPLYARFKKRQEGRTSKE